MNIPNFNEFSISLNEEMTAGDKIEKSSALNDKINKLKQDLKKAIESKDNKKVEIIQLKIDMAELDRQKFNLQKKLEQLSK